MEKIYVSGWWGENFGDDLFLKVLLEKYPNVKFFSHSGENGVQQFKNYKNISFINIDNKNIRIVNSALRKIKIPQIQNLRALLTRNYLELGGSIFLEEDDWEGKARNRLKFSKIMKTYFIIGSNFGPTQNAKFIKAYKLLFENVNYVRFRDLKSKGYFKDLDNVSVSPDVVFNLNIEEYKVKEKKVVNISVISVERMYRNKNRIPTEYYNKIGELCSYYVKKGYNVVLMAYSEISGDKLAAEEILKTTSAEIQGNISIYVHNNVEKSLRKIAEAEIVIPSRFHGMIVGWLFEKKMHVLSYSQKTNNTVKYIDDSFPITEIDKLVDTPIEDIYRNVKKIKKETIEQVKAASKGQFKELDEYVRRNYQ